MVRVARTSWQMKPNSSLVVVFRCDEGVTEKQDPDERSDIGTQFGNRNINIPP